MNSIEKNTRDEHPPGYVLVTAAQNEAEFIERTIESVVSQTIQPMRWVIVNDGSTDGTEDIIEKYARKHNWIHLLSLPVRKERTFARKAIAFNLGWESLNDLPYQAIANLDADVSFSENYFAFLLDKLSGNPRFGLIGTAFEDCSLHYDYRFVSVEHVAGPCQFFRRKCLEDIGGYVRSKSGGIDVIAVLTARMKGWETRTFPEISFTHNRKMGTATNGLFKARFRTGRKDYLLGSHPLWEIFRTIYQATKTPYIIGALALSAGYFSAVLRRPERPLTPELIAFRRHEQMLRLRKLFKLTGAA